MCACVRARVCAFMRMCVGRLRMYAYAYAVVCVRLRACACVCACVCVYAQMRAFSRGGVWLSANACIFEYGCMHAWVGIHACACTCVCGRLSTRVCAFLRACATMVDYRRLGRKIVNNCLTNKLIKIQVNFYMC